MTTTTLLRLIKMWTRFDNRKRLCNAKQCAEKLKVISHKKKSKKYSNNFFFGSATRFWKSCFLAVYAIWTRIEEKKSISCIFSYTQRARQANVTFSLLIWLFVEHMVFFDYVYLTLDAIGKHTFSIYIPGLGSGCVILYSFSFTYELCFVATFTLSLCIGFSV